MHKELKTCYNKSMRYYRNQNYNMTYQNAVAQDFANWATKFMLSKFIVSLAPQQDKRQVEMFCDGASGIMDVVNPPQTQEGRVLALSTNIYNLSKFL